MKTIEITDEQYELIQQEQEHIMVDATMSDMIEMFMNGYAYHYSPDPSFSASDALEANQ